MVSEHFHPWTPPAGPDRVRLGVHGRARAADVAAVRDRGHVPRLPLPPGRRRPRGGDPRRDVPGPVLARARRRRGAQRAHPRRRVAGGDVRSEMLFESIEIISKLFTGGVVKHGASTSSSRARSSTRARRARPDLRRDLRPHQRQEDRQVRPGDDHGRRGRREDRAPLGRATRARREAGKDPAVPSSSSSTSAGPGPRRRPSRTRCGSGPTAGWPSQAGHQEPRGLRGDGQAGPAGGLQEPGPDHARTSRPTPRTSSTTWTWASTRSTSTTSGATRPSSSRSSARRSCRTCAWAGPSGRRSSALPRRPMYAIRAGRRPRLRPLRDGAGRSRPSRPNPAARALARCRPVAPARTVARALPGAGRRAVSMSLRRVRVRVVRACLGRALHADRGPAEDEQVQVEFARTPALAHLASGGSFQLLERGQERECPAGRIRAGGAHRAPRRRCGTPAGR